MGSKHACACREGERKRGQPLAGENGAGVLVAPPVNSNTRTNKESEKWPDVCEGGVRWDREVCLMILFKRLGYHERRLNS